MGSPLIRRCIGLSLLGLAVACSGGSSSSPSATSMTATEKLLVTDGTAVLAPAATPLPAVDPAQVDPSAIAAWYRFTTPADTPFTIELVSWVATTPGTAQVTLRHLRDGAYTVNDVSSLVIAGITLRGEGLSHDARSISALGAGVARMTVQGRIAADQQLLVTTDATTATLIEIAIGPASTINRPAEVPSPLPAGATLTTPYTSNSWLLGGPALAIDGGRTNIVCNEGLHGRPAAFTLHELRMQQSGSGLVGGAVVLPSGSLRRGEHAVAAFGDVLALVRSEHDGLRVEVSFDGGTSFAQQTLVATGIAVGEPAIAFAADGSLAVAGWCQAGAGGLDFVLVDARPAAVGTSGAPTWYQCDPPQVVFAAPSGARPLDTELAWSAGNDLAVAYGWTEFVAGPTWTARTDCRSAVRVAGGVRVDRVVAQQDVVGGGCSVALANQGPALRVMYAHEANDGIRLVTSADGGATFAAAATLGRSGDRLPRVVARENGGALRLDVFWLASRTGGRELLRASWADWPSSPRVDSSLTTASLAVLLAWQMRHGLFYVPGWIGPVLETTQVSDRGFDVARDGSDLVVAFDEVTVDNGSTVLGCLYVAPPGALLPPIGFVTAPEPPPVAAGLTEPLRAPAATDTHKLRLLRLP